jgi:hypothetical protein
MQALQSSRSWSSTLIGIGREYAYLQECRLWKVRPDHKAPATGAVPLRFRRPQRAVEGTEEGPGPSACRNRERARPPRHEEELMLGPCEGGCPWHLE